MVVEGLCRACMKWFDAHWHNYPELGPSEAVMNPYCPYCKSTDVRISTDESDDAIELTSEEDE